MRYSALARGKRIRPLLVYASADALGLEIEALDGVACSIELIHAYSLIHDDLPAMDDDTLRRGLPTCHVQFDEATAILAGDALQALAFEILSRSMHRQPEVGIRLMSQLALACGSTGMAGGQVLDLNAAGKKITVEELEQIHRLKTGCLIELAVLAPAEIAQADAAVHGALQSYGSCIGLGFQVRDDILDVVGNAAETGKNSQTDAKLDKPTYPALVGLENSRSRADALRDEALRSLEILAGDVSTLTWLAHHIVSRDR